MITLDNVTLCYRDRPAVHHLSGQFARGSLTAIVGPNGQPPQGSQFVNFID